MKVINETAKERIALAYDLFKRDEFLERLFKFLDDAEDTIVKIERTKADAETFAQRIIDAVKIKPGPKPKLKELTDTQE